MREGGIGGTAMLGPSNCIRVSERRDHSDKHTPCAVRTRAQKYARPVALPRLAAKHD
jgi:hypothetical protein